MQPRRPPVREPSAVEPAARRSRAFTLVFRDDDIVVVDKAPGVLTVPTARRERFTLVDEVSRLLSRGPRITREAQVVHRLDRETSGLVVFAVHRAARDRLVQAWSSHERLYTALVDGIVADDDGEIVSRLVTDRRTLQRRSLARDEDISQGESAVTHFVVDQRLDDASMLSVRLLTGRRNQIRVHLAEQGHAVLGDDRYGGAGRHRRWDDRRLALHARQLGFAHPRTGEPLHFDTGMPAVFARFVAGATAGGDGRPRRASTNQPGPGARGSTQGRGPRSTKGPVRDAAATHEHAPGSPRRRR
jgi:23S rRNA pseudouridine1911/1915/1917 synthase